MRRLASPTWLVACVFPVWLGVAGTVHAQQPDDAKSTFSSEQLEQLVAPIALYPDSLVAQILMASTYPLEIVQAHRWREANPQPEGEALEQALAGEPWDASVKSLTNFPSVLERMSDNLDWTQDLGDAVIGQEAAVMDAIQHMRRLAHDAGNLKSTPEQKVIVQEKVIVVEPAAKVVYVPVYSPTVVYGPLWGPPTWYYPFYRYPPAYWYPPGYAAASVIAFGVGVAVTVSIWNRWSWGHCDWRGRGVTINNNFDFSRNVNTGNINIGNTVGGGDRRKWQHDARHRRGVRYRDPATAQRFARAGDRATAHIDRDAARGFAPRGGAARPGASRPQTRPQTPPGASRPQTPPGASRPQTRPQTPPGASRPQTRPQTPPGASRPQTRPQRPTGQAAGRAAGGSRPPSAFSMSPGDQAAARRGASSRARAGGGRRR